MKTSVLLLHLIDTPVIVITVVSFFVASVWTYWCQVAAEQKRGSLLSFLNFCFPFDAWSRASAQMDVKIYIVNRLTYGLVGWVEPACKLSVAAAVSWLLMHTFPHEGLGASSYLTAICCGVILVLASEFALYWSHQMEHRIPVLWELHKLHHSATFLSPLTGARLHPLSIMFGGGFQGVVTGLTAGLVAFAFGLGIPELVLLHASALKLCKAVTLESLRHSHYPISFGALDVLMMSPHMHIIHHSSLELHWNKNFGASLSLYDWMFGTMYLPKKGEDVVLGLGNTEELEHNDFVGAYLGPIGKALRLISSSPATPSPPSH
jgi:sterol desaturase/sphingolipid hydroxylase (fatty acid hydroxylase superfamily)